MNTAVAINNTPVNLADPEAEVRLLAVLLRFPHLLDEVFIDLQPCMFTVPVYATVYQVMQREYSVKQRAGTTDIYMALRKEPGIDNAAALLDEIKKHLLAEADLPGCVERVIEAYRRRKVTEGLKRLYDLVVTEDDMETVQAAIAEETSAWLTRYEMHEATTEEALGELYPDWQLAKDGKPKPKGPDTGLMSFDTLTNCVANGTLLVLAGRPSMGKTAVALNLAAGMARRHGWILFSSLEMTYTQAVSRLVQARARVTSSQIDNGCNGNEQLQAEVDKAFNDLYRLPIYWVDKRGLSAPELCAVARKAKREHDITAWFIDYLQLIKLGNERNRTTSLLIGDIVRQIRDCAGDLNIPVILLSQLNRNVEQRNDKRPMMSDLRESGNIEEFADYIVFVYRPAYYEPNQAELDESARSELQLIIEKSRITGRRGIAQCTFIEDYQYIVSRDPEQRRWEWLEDTTEGRKSWW
jgi:replicative DNA helicase